MKFLPEIVQLPLSPLHFHNETVTGLCENLTFHIHMNIKIGWNLRKRNEYSIQAMQRCGRGGIFLFGKKDSQGL